MDDACVGGEAGHLDGSLGPCEIDDSVGAGGEVEEIVGDGNAERGKACKDADVLADGREPDGSAPPATTQPGAAWMARISSRPMRPAAPITAILMSVMRSPAVNVCADIAM